ncbi:glycosyltransferase [Erwinia sp. JUb26]|uniref:glycosyltransferase n=1 Tax=Erwinia sp. JUb26 TaxID=2485126 RepID=UPI000F49492C|nr:glycosyltransferase [Erwinia sp. JUb26]ROR07722.1 UDP-N-acetylglucosamine transferase subunit ALG13 [Erwinia sp. JUb26]
MIFCSVGTQLPFQRLVEFIIRWSNEIDFNKTEIIIQSGSSVDVALPENIKVLGFISVQEFSSIFERAELIVSHAGMGNIISSLELAKPIVILPRLSSLNEHRNDHQIDSANRFSELDTVFVANDYDDFCDSIRNAKEFKSGSLEMKYPEREKLTNYLKAEISN